MTPARIKPDADPVALANKAGVDVAVIEGLQALGTFMVEFDTDSNRWWRPVNTGNPALDGWYLSADDDIELLPVTP